MDLPSKNKNLFNYPRFLLNIKSHDDIKVLFWLALFILPFAALGELINCLKLSCLSVIRLYYWLQILLLKFAVGATWNICIVSFCIPNKSKFCSIIFELRCSAIIFDKAHNTKIMILPACIRVRKLVSSLAAAALTLPLLTICCDGPADLLQFSVKIYADPEAPTEYGGGGQGKSCGASLV